MSNPPVITYPLDLSSTSPNNLVVGEPHDLAATGNRAFVANHGPFFTKGLVVRNRNTGLPLTAETQYKAVQLFVEATIRTGMEICSVIVITDDTVGNAFEIDYRVLGGEYSASVYAIEQLIASLSIDNRSVQWGSIIGKPEAFPPAPHLHDIGDVYGFEYIVAQLEAIRNAILMGDSASHQEIIQYVDHQDQQLRDSIANFDQDLRGHLDDRDNPHQVTKDQIGLGAVQNYGIADQASAIAGAANNLYMTPLRTREAIAQQAGDLIQAHVNNQNNPHNVTKAQVGLSDVVNAPMATLAQAQAGTGTGYMSASLTASAIAAQALAPLNAHIGRVDNPHDVTKAQVGLGLVANYQPASTAEANAGTATDRYMTPALVRSAITALVGNQLTAHMGDFNNPHQTTKAQVGLGSVDNFPTASTPEAQAGAATNRFMTPALTAAAISQQALIPLNNHITNASNPHNVTKAQVGLGSVDNARQVYLGGGSGMGSNVVRLGWSGSAILAQVDNPPMGQIHTTNQPDPNLTNHLAASNNPHGTTKAQVGLGSVDNFPTASQAEAIAGTANNRFMTPLRVAEAMAVIMDGGFAGSFGNPGWIRLPGDLYLQWGVITGGSEDFVVYFPKQFTQTPAVLATPIGTSTYDPSRYRYDVASINGNSFRIQHGGFGPFGHNWFAIGTGNGQNVVAGGGGVGVGGVGGGVGGGGCVTTRMFLKEDLQAGSVQIDDWIDGASYEEGAEGIVARQVRSNKITPQPVYRMTTVSDIDLEASDSTPVTLRDGTSKWFHEMEGEEVLVDDNGEIRWEKVKRITYLGEMDVVLINIDDHSYFAGSNPKRRIATHNMAKDTELP